MTTLFLAMYGLVVLLSAISIKFGTTFGPIKSLAVAVFIPIPTVLYFVAEGIVVVANLLFDLAFLAGGEDRTSFLMSAIKKRIQVESGIDGGDGSDNDTDLH